MRWFVPKAGAAIALLAAVSPPAVLAADPTLDGSRPGIVGTSPLFTADDLLLLEVRVGNALLTDGLGAYSSRAGVFLPVGELARLLDFAIVTDPPERTASGWFLAPGRTIVVDAGRRVAESQGEQFTLGPTEVAFFDDEVYVRSDVLGRLLPITFVASRSEATLQLTPREPLPFQERLEREQRRAGLDGVELNTRPPLVIGLPYRLATAPAIDVDLALGASNEAPERTTYWDLRLAGDLLYMGMQAWVGSDENGSPDSARFTLERRGFAQDGSGAISGPITSAGDVYTPTLGIGMASQGGRGVSFTTEPRLRANVFDSVDLRGEMPAGYEAELYVNEVLRASQSSPTQGQYQFLGVPLVVGLNVIRIAFYGPRGERYEEVRRINVGGGQLARGETDVSFGVLDQGVPLFDLSQAPPTDATPIPGYGDTTYAAMLTHGFSNALTGRIGTGRYTPYPDDTRNLFNAGLAAAWGGFALQFDYSRDDADGQAESLGLAGRIGSVPVVLRHVEYQGTYADQLSGSALDETNPERRYTDIRTDFGFRFPGSSRRLPATFEVRRDERDDGSTGWMANASTTLTAGRVLFSTGLGYNRNAPANGSASETLTGSFDASTILAREWQVRANVGYNLLPSAEIVSTGITFDRNLSPRTALRFGVQQDWTDTRYTSLNTGLTWRTAFFDMTFGATYVTRLESWTAGLQVSAGALFDPLRRRYRGVRPGATVGGTLALDAFVDTNGDGRHQAGESGLAGLQVVASEFTPVADSEGHLLVPGLGDNGTAYVNLDMQTIEDPYLQPPAETLLVTTRPGRVAVASFPLQSRGEATVHFAVQLPGGGERGIAALAVELLDASGKVVATGRTEYDGTVLFEGLTPGRYVARLDAEQSQRLKLALEKPVEVFMPAGGGYAGVIEARVAVQR